MLMGAVLVGATQAGAEPKRRFNTVTWDNYDPNNPRFEFEQEKASCARPMGGVEHFVVAQGWNPAYSYYDKLFEDDCMYETKELHWLVKASRPQDGLKWQCRVRLLRRYDQAQDEFVTRIETEAAQPVAPGSPDLCTNGTLFKSATCEISDAQEFGRGDCLNRDSEYNGKIKIKFGGPPLPVVPASEQINPLTGRASR